MAAHRTQLWTEAMTVYPGMPAYLPRTLIQAQTAVNRAAVTVDESLEDALLAFLDGHAAGAPFRIADVKPYVEGRLKGDLPSDKRLAVELQRLDCEWLGVKQAIWPCRQPAPASRTAFKRRLLET